MVETALVILTVLVSVTAVAVVVLEGYLLRKTESRLREIFGPDYKGPLARYRDQRRREKEFGARDLEPLRDVKAGGIKSKSKSGAGGSR